MGRICTVILVVLLAAPCFAGWDSDWTNMQDRLYVKAVYFSNLVAAANEKAQAAFDGLDWPAGVAIIETNISSTGLYVCGYYTDTWTTVSGTNTLTNSAIYTNWCMAYETNIVTNNFGLYVKPRYLSQIDACIDGMMYRYIQHWITTNWVDYLSTNSGVWPSQTKAEAFSHLGIGTTNGMWTKYPVVSMPVLAWWDASNGFKQGYSIPYPGVYGDDTNSHYVISYHVGGTNTQTNVVLISIRGSPYGSTQVDHLFTITGTNSTTTTNFWQDIVSMSVTGSFANPGDGLVFSYTNDIAIYDGSPTSTISGQVLYERYCVLTNLIDTWISFTNSQEWYEETEQFAGCDTAEIVSENVPTNGDYWALCGTPSSAGVQTGFSSSAQARLDIQYWRNSYEPVGGTQTFEIAWFSDLRLLSCAPSHLANTLNTNVALWELYWQTNISVDVGGDYTSWADYYVAYNDGDWHTSNGYGGSLYALYSSSPQEIDYDGKPVLAPDVLSDVLTISPTGFCMNLPDLSTAEFTNRSCNGITFGPDNQGGPDWPQTDYGYRYKILGRNKTATFRIRYQYEY